MTTATEPTRWKSPYRDADHYQWKREYDVKNGVREALREILIDNVNHASGKFVRRETVARKIGYVLGAVTPERRIPLALALMDAHEAWYAAAKAVEAGERTNADRLAAHRPLSRLLDEAADAQISGIRFLYCGGAR